MNRWLRRYSHEFRAMVNECPECGSEKIEATPFCPVCGAYLDDNEGQVGYDKEQCGREKMRNGGKKQLLPVIFGMNPPTKEVILVPCRGQWHGIDVHIFHADLPGYHVGEEIKSADFSEIHSEACWLHFTDSETLRKFGEVLINAADKFNIKEEKQNG